MIKRSDSLDIHDLDGEIWEDIEGYDGAYQVSNFGRIKSWKCDNGMILNFRNNEEEMNEQK